MDANFFYDLVGTYGLIAIFILAALEGDITLLLAGVLAHSGFFGEWSFVAVVAAGTAGAVASDHIAYLLGHGVHSGAGNYRFYRHVRPRVERLSENFGASAISFFVKNPASTIFSGEIKSVFPANAEKD